MDDNRKGALLVILAGTCWGVISIFINYLSAAGLGEMQISFLRQLFAVLVWAVPLQKPEPRTFIQLAENAQIETRSIDGADLYSAKSTQLAEHTVTEPPTDTVAVVTPATLMEVKNVSVQQKSKGSVKNMRADSRRTSTRLSAADMFRLTEVGRKALQKDKAILVLELN